MIRGCLRLPSPPGLPSDPPYALNLKSQPFFRSYKFIKPTSLRDFALESSGFSPKGPDAVYVRWEAEVALKRRPGLMKFHGELRGSETTDERVSALLPGVDGSSRCETIPSTSSLS